MGCTTSNFDIDNIYKEEISIFGEETKAKLGKLKKSICIIKLANGKKGNGFFCRIKIATKNDLLPVLITNNTLLDEKSILPGKKIKIITKNKKSKEILIF